MNAHTLVWFSLAMQDEPGPVPIPAPKSTLMWIIETGAWVDLLTVMLGFVIFMGVLRVVTTGQKTSTIAAYLVLLPLPTFICLLGQLKGIYASLSVIAVSGVQPSGAEWAGGFAESVLSLFVCLLVTFPSYLVLAYGLLASTRNSSSVSPTA